MKQAVKTNEHRVSGGATLLYISLITIIAVLILTASYSRLLLAIKRTGSLADNLIASYTAESEVNNIIALVLSGQFSLGNNFSFDRMIGGTRVRAQGVQTNETTQTITVTASRSFAVSRLLATRTLATTTASADTDMVLSLDCTGSMEDNDPLDDASAPTLFDRQREAALNFVDLLISEHAQNPSQDFRLGLIAFKINAQWVVTPTTNLTQVRNIIASQFGSTLGESEACDGLIENTSIGSAFLLAHEYFESVPATRAKVEVTISDGRINSHPPSEECGYQYLCPYDNERCEENSGYQCQTNGSGQYLTGRYYDSHNLPNRCAAEGRDFVRCVLATPGDPVPDGAHAGIRDPNVDAYMVTIFRDYNQIGAEEQIFRDYATGYYNTTRGEELTPILEDIFNIITTGTSRIIIQRIIPQQ